MSLAPKFCGECGAPLSEGIRFCGKCGATVADFQNSTQNKTDKKAAPTPPPKTKKNVADPPEKSQTYQEQPQRPAPKVESELSPKKTAVWNQKSIWIKLFWLLVAALAMVLLGGINELGIALIIATAVYIFIIKRKKIPTN